MRSEDITLVECGDQIVTQHQHRNVEIETKPSWTLISTHLIRVTGEGQARQLGLMIRGTGYT